MKTDVKALYQAHEFAQRAGTTVRTLHHYDRMGLLKPTGYTRAGFRLYGQADLIRLQQIVTLKFIGFSLKEIKQLLSRNGMNLVDSLARQKQLIEEKRRHLDRAISALAYAEAILKEEKRTDWDAFHDIIEVINMQQDMKWVKSYYTEEQLADLAKRYDPELARKAEQDWKQLFADVEAALGEDPGSEKVQQLAARWEALITAFTGGDPGIRENLGRLYADQSNWQGDFKRPWSDEIGAFMNQALAIYRQK
ncbi:MAG: MerR family transcriptional regulator [Blastocatellia bacterium]|nr:MerR family transcriptional regulator [Blastocatellia bacterium]